MKSVLLLLASQKKYLLRVHCTLIEFSILSRISFSKIHFSVFPYKSFITIIRNGFWRTWTPSSGSSHGHWTSSSASVTVTPCSTGRPVPVPHPALEVGVGQVEVHAVGVAGVLRVAVPATLVAAPVVLDDVPDTSDNDEDSEEGTDDDASHCEHPKWCILYTLWIINRRRRSVSVVISLLLSLWLHSWVGARGSEVGFVGFIPVFAQDPLVFSGDCLEDVILVWNQILDNPTVLGGGEEVGHLVVVGVPRQPGLDDELVGTLASGHQTWPGHSHAGQRHLFYNRRTFKSRVCPQSRTVTSGPVYQYCCQ